MQKIHTGPSATVTQLSAKAPGGQAILAVLARVTYDVDADGRCRFAEQQTPLTEEPQAHPDEPSMMLVDSDFIAYKLRSDVIVHGHVYGHRRAARLEAQVRVGTHEKRLAVLGERTCTLGPAGGLRFSAPAAIDRVALDYRLAYGGRDRGAEALHGNPALALASEAPPGCDLDQASPFLYPRNPAGRGYLIDATPDAVERLQLPQLEDPQDLLTPERLAVREIDLWHRMPLPAATGWVDYGWYPRVAFAGVVPINDSFDEPPIEVLRGLVPAYLADGAGQTVDLSAFELMSGASLGLQLPYLRGGEAVELMHLHRARQRWGFQVPPPPDLHADARQGKLHATEPVVHTLLVDPDGGRITVVWRGAAPAIRGYTPEELERMPLRVAWR